MSNFLFPRNAKDIQYESNDGSYYCQQQLDQLQNLTREFIDKYFQSLQIELQNDILHVQHKQFDFLYLFLLEIENYNEEQVGQNKKMIRSIGSILQEYLDGFTFEIKNQISKQAKNGAKFLLFLNLLYIRNVNITKKKVLAQTKQLYNEEISSVLGVNISSIYKFLNITSLKELFTDTHVELTSMHNMQNLLIEICIKIFENKPLIKNHQNQAFNLIDLVIKNQNNNQQHQESNQHIKTLQIKFINLVYEDENFIQPIVSFISNQFQNKICSYINNFTLELLNLFNNFLLQKNQKKNQQKITNEQNVFRHANDFLTQLSKEIPRFFYVNLSLFYPLLDCEQYQLRNTVVNIMYNIISNQSENTDEEQTAAQNCKLIKKLESRFYDKTSFCRSHLLLIFGQMCDLNIIPTEFLSNLLQKASQRTQDISSHVRKRAIQLIGKLIRSYMFIFNTQTVFLSVSDVQTELQMIKHEENEYQQQLNNIDEEMMQISKQVDNIMVNNNMQEQQQDHNNLLELFDQKQGEKEIITKKQKQCKKKVSYLNEYIYFLDNVNKTIPNLIRNLGSKNNADIIESIRLLLVLNKTNIDGAMKGLDKVLLLIWSKEKVIKEEVMITYFKLYFHNDFKPKQIAQNLFLMVNNKSIQQIISLEELLVNILDNKEKENIEYEFRSIKVEQFLWEQFQSCYAKFIETQTYDNVIYQMRNCIQLLRVMNGKTNFLTQKVQRLDLILKDIIKIQVVDWVLLKEITLVLIQIKKMNLRCNQTLELLNSCLKTLIFILTKNHGTQDKDYYTAVDYIIKLIFKISSTPEKIMHFILKQMSTFLYNNNDNDKELPENFELIQKFQEQQAQLANLNPEEDAEAIQKISIEINMNFMQLGVANMNKLIYELKLGQALFVASATALNILHNIEQLEEKLNEKHQKNDTLENELEQLNGGKDAAHEYQIKQLNQIANQILENKIFKFFLELAQNAVYDYLKAIQLQNVIKRNVFFDRIAVLALLRFMIVSEKVTKNNLDLIFGLLNSNTDSIVKTNILIATADLYRRFPLKLQLQLNHLYSLLNHPPIELQCTCLKIITHLVLNDLLKVKNEVYHIAKLIINGALIKQVQLFFVEISKKDPKIMYNIMPDLIQRMSKEEENVFYLVCKNILTIIDKDKNTEVFVNKVCQRFEALKQIKDDENFEMEKFNLSLVLNYIPHNEKSLRILLEYFESYRLCLQDEDILLNFKSLVVKLKRTPNKGDMKQLIDELEQKIFDKQKEQFDGKLFVKKKKQYKKKENKKMILENESFEDEELLQDYQSQQIQSDQKRSQRNLRSGKKKYVEVEDYQSENEYF